MEAVQRRMPSEGLKKFLSSRRGAWTLAIASAALAGIVLLVFLNRYKESVNADVAPAPVLVADRLIPKGTAGDVVISGKLFRPAALAEQDLRPGAVSDAVAMQGRVATRDILPGQQITATDFTDFGGRHPRQAGQDAAGDPDPGRRARGPDRHHPRRRPGRHPRQQQRRESGCGRQRIRARLDGDADARRVVLAAPAAGATTGGLIFQVTDRQAAQLAFAASNGKIWLLLRPPVGAKDSKPLTVTPDTLLDGKSVEVTADYEATPNGGSVTINAQQGGEQP